VPSSQPTRRCSAVRSRRSTASRRQNGAPAAAVRSATNRMRRHKHSGQVQALVDAHRGRHADAERLARDAVEIIEGPTHSRTRVTRFGVSPTSSPPAPAPKPERLSRRHWTATSVSATWRWHAGASAARRASSRHSATRSESPRRHRRSLCQVQPQLGSPKQHLDL
jgi:hypothetical protein